MWQPNRVTRVSKIYIKNIYQNILAPNFDFESEVRKLTAAWFSLVASGQETNFFYIYLVVKKTPSL